ncbi:MAG: hypothetical protein ACXVPU_04785 [Bacteroidia bacterium]
MKYPEIAIRALINTIDDDEAAYKWLTESEWKELAAFNDVLYSEDNSQALEFLLQHKDKYATIVNFLAALESQDKAFELLMINDKEWAATVSAVHGSGDAYKWLENNNFLIFTELADVLIKYSPTRRSSGIAGYAGYGGSGGFGGGGFGGFGGGSFGGGGGGGKW